MTILEKQYASTMDDYEYLLLGNLDLDNYDNPYAFLQIVGLEYSLLVFHIILICLTIIVNIYMIYFICSQKKARTSHNLTIVSIAAANVLIAAGVQPIQIALYLNTSTEMQKAPFFMCKMIRYLSFWFKSVIMYSTLFMVLNRYLKFIHPRSATFLTGRCMFYLSMVWFSGAAYNIWKVMLYDARILPIHPQDNRNLSVRQCCANNVVDYFFTIRIGFLISDFIVIFAAPFILMTVIFVNIIRRLCRSYNPQNKVKGAGRILTSLLFFLLFIVCQLPYQVCEVYYDHVTQMRETDVTIMHVFMTISYMQGFCIVVAYMLCSEEFHATWKLTLFKPPEASSQRTSAATRVLIRTNSCDNIVESICMR